MVGGIDNVFRHDHCLDIVGIHVVEGFTAVVIRDKSLVNYHWTILSSYSQLCTFANNKPVMQITIDWYK